jgi:hypothetical protein
MAEQSHREEMSAAIRAQRERQAAPRTLAAADAPAPEPSQPDRQPDEQPEAEPETRSGRISRFFGK